jgi:hypothetical protein
MQRHHEGVGIVVIGSGAQGGHESGMAVSVVQGGSFAHAEIVTDLRTPDKRLWTDKTRTKRASAAQNHPQESELSHFL